MVTEDDAGAPVEAPGCDQLSEVLIDAHYRFVDVFDEADLPNEVDLEGSADKAGESWQHPSGENAVGLPGHKRRNPVVARSRADGERSGLEERSPDSSEGVVVGSPEL